MVENPAPLPELFLPRHRIIGPVTISNTDRAAAANGVHVPRSIEPTLKAGQARPLQGCVVMIHQRLVHAPFPKARKGIVGPERPHPVTIPGALCSKCVHITTLKHDHPELPRARGVLDLTLCSQVEFLEGRIEIYI